MSTEHELKTDPKVFDAVAKGLKKFEIRFDDRGYQVGDTLVLRKTMHTGEEMKRGAPLEYVSPKLYVNVTHILRGPIYGLEQGWVCMSIQPADLSSAHVVDAEPVCIKIPTNADEAEAMEKLGFQWLAQNAPERLTEYGKQRAQQTATVPEAVTEKGLQAEREKIGMAPMNNTWVNGYVNGFNECRAAMLTAAPSNTATVQIDERAEFEKFFANKWPVSGNLERFRKDSDGAYPWYPDVNSVWKGWKARASLGREKS